LPIGVLAALAGWLAAAPCWACAVCGGDKHSAMVKGALSGVIVMVAVTYGLLLVFGAMLVACFVRARRLRAARPTDASEPDQGPS
jgi:hypothetical protein